VTGLLLALLVVLNVVSFALFGIDKRRARRGEWRISESTLLLSGLISGTIGAWAGIYTFRHKSSKPSFLLKLVLLTAVDIVVVAALLAR
jgi:uncharacterized membrane protein YsdA (DUF1294 family)